MRLGLAKILAISAFVVCGATAANADAYTSATFSGGFFSAPNIKAPFIGVVPPNSTFTGTFVYDNNLIPAAGSGFVNVLYSNLPDIANISNTAAFHLAFDGIDLNLGNDIGGGAIQYKNGKFNGFALNLDFTYNALPYELTISGGQLNVVAIVGGFPTFDNLLTGYINIGDNAVTGKSPFTPTVPGGPTTGVPEPVTITLFGAGLVAAAGLRRRRKAKQA